MNNKLQKLNVEHFKLMFTEVGIAIKNGELPPLEFLKFLKIEKLTSIITKDKKLREIALEEAAKYPEKEGEFEGLKWQYKNGSGRYDYSCSPTWVARKEQIDKLNQLNKDEEEEMKMAYKMSLNGKTMVNEETGEVVSVPKFTPYSDSISVK